MRRHMIRCVVLYACSDFAQFPIAVKQIPEIQWYNRQVWGFTMKLHDLWDHNYTCGHLVYKPPLLNDNWQNLSNCPETVAHDRMQGSSVLTQHQSVMPARSLITRTSRQKWIVQVQTLPSSETIANLSWLSNTLRVELTYRVTKHKNVQKTQQNYSVVYTTGIRSCITT